MYILGNMSDYLWNYMFNNSSDYYSMYISGNIIDYLYNYMFNNSSDYLSEIYV